VKHHRVNTHVGVKVHLDAFLTLRLDGVDLSASRPGRFAPEINRLYLLDRRLGEQQNQSGRRGEKFLPLPGIESRLLGRPAHSLITILTQLSLLLLEVLANFFRNGLI
jgi:hypothetical protein